MDQLLRRYIKGTWNMKQVPEGKNSSYKTRAFLLRGKWVQFWLTDISENEQFRYSYIDIASFFGIWAKNETRNNDYQLRNDDLFILPTLRIELFRKVPLYSLPHAWNELSDSLRYQHNRTTFKIALSDSLFDSLSS